VHIFSTAHPYMQTSVNFNNLVILWCTDIYEVTVLLLRTLRFPQFKTCETTDELRWVIKSSSSCPVPSLKLIFLYIMI